MAANADTAWILNELSWSIMSETPGTGETTKLNGAQTC
jgi:hypothetical protein